MIQEAQKGTRHADAPKKAAPHAERKLGNGLEALIEDFRAPDGSDLVHLPPESIDPNPRQPRLEFKPDALEELVASIARHGILQPLLVRRSKAAGRHEIVAGERRLRAALRLGMGTVPCIVADVPDDKLLEFALVENLQRQDLDPIEIATAYRALMIQCKYTQEDLAEKLCLGRSTIANALRLLELPDPLRENVSRGTLTAGHARAIASLPGASAQKALAARVARDSLTVRETEQAVKRLNDGESKPPTRRTRPAYLGQVEDRLRKRLGTKVSIQETGPSRGRIVIDFYGEEDFERLLAMFE
jgi:ParB family chromosome partitioning protein